MGDLAALQVAAPFVELLVGDGLFARAVKLVAAFVLVYGAGRGVVEPLVVRAVRARNENNPTVVGAVELYLRVGVVAVAFGAALAAAGYTRVLTRSTIAVAIVSLTVGVAGREVLGTLVGGLFLVTDPNFNVGDYVAWGDTEGIVESIGFRVTRVRTVDNEIISVPNTELTTNVITKPYGQNQFRINEEVGVYYEEGLEEAIEILRDEAVTDPAILNDPQPKIRVRSFEGDHIRVQVLFWVSEPTRRTVLDTFSDYARRVQARCEATDITLGATSAVDMGGGLAVERADE
ncbi:mechanosensitive ion channel family protein [Haloprofundus sp. MHR1]|uniref:mechanosensitive ion channel family protein n=1 Tax=Haloprofundus sp. MHR1 TaxID=2572921 RepID=UPI0010BF0F32|nr:mechanosensitive ion channel domain-containing protein [Haloprofundus sp. MHR1]QCJ47270.1 mechanosensitive ion channel [Haloprofundus sp. MHR1]